MKRTLTSFLLLFLILASAQSTAVAYSSDPEKFIGEIIDEAKVILSSSSSQDINAEQLSKIALKTVDVKGIGYYTLGKKRKEITEDQINKYNKVFESYFLKSFTSRLTDYSDPKISVLSAEKINEKYTIVKSMLVKTDKKPEVKIDWRVYTKNPEDPLIRDLIIEGLSLARTQKEEFSSILSSNNNDINALFSKLEEFIKK